MKGISQKQSRRGCIRAIRKEDYAKRVPSGGDNWKKGCQGVYHSLCSFCTVQTFANTYTAFRKNLYTGYGDTCL
jgi:hypothetical protein